MTMITPIGGDEAARAVLDAAEQHFARTIAALNDIIEEVNAGRTSRARELKAALGDLGKAAQTAFDERARVEKRIRTDAGIVSDYALDLDAARDEIRRRLARLRDSAGAGGFSEGAE